MKIEVEISPEEVRRLFGLPDTTMMQNMFMQRVDEWVKQTQDGEFVQKWFDAVVQGGRQSFDAYQEFLRGFGRVARGETNKRPDGRA